MTTRLYWKLFPKWPQQTIAGPLWREEIEIFLEIVLKLRLKLCKFESVYKLPSSRLCNLSFRISTHKKKTHCFELLLT